MDKDLLYNFYKGKVSIEEGQRVKAWVEASDETSALSIGNVKFLMP